MADQYLSLPHDPNGLLVQSEDDTIRQTGSSEAPYLWNQCLLEWSQTYLANTYSQETASSLAAARNPRTKWPQSIARPTARPAIFSKGQSPETLPSTFPHRNFDGSIGNQAGAMVDMVECHTHAEYSQHITKQEGYKQLTRRQLLECGINSPSIPGGNVQRCWPRKPNAVSSYVYPGQVSQQSWEVELEEARKYPDPGSAWNSRNRSKASGGLHHCTKCNKAYQRPQDLMRHARDKHIRLRKCPFCCTKWSRPERIRVHLVKKHESRLTNDQQQEIRSLRGRDDTIRFLEICGKATHHGNYTSD